MQDGVLTHAVQLKSCKILTWTWGFEGSDCLFGILVKVLTDCLQRRHGPWGLVEVSPWYGGVLNRSIYLPSCVFAWPNVNRAGPLDEVLLPLVLCVTPVNCASGTLLGAPLAEADVILTWAELAAVVDEAFDL